MLSLNSCISSKSSSFGDLCIGAVDAVALDSPVANFMVGVRWLESSKETGLVDVGDVIDKLGDTVAAAEANEVSPEFE